MKKVNSNEEWCLFCPDECKDLSNTYGDEFENLYSIYESKTNLLENVKLESYGLQF